jgi:hypothetical protein
VIGLPSPSPPDHVPLNLLPSRVSFIVPSNRPASLAYFTSHAPVASESFFKGSAAFGVIRTFEKYDSSPAYPHNPIAPRRFAPFNPSTTKLGFAEPFRKMRADRPDTSILNFVHVSG